MATNDCGTSSDAARIDYRPCDCVLYIPTSFTPNGDNVNEHFGPVPISGCELSEFTFAIYDRRGNLLYQTANPEQPRDGRLKGAEVPLGLYA